MLTHNHWCLQPSITQQWIRPWAWFFTAWCCFIFLPTAVLYVQYMHHGFTYLFPPLHSYFCWQHKVLTCDSFSQAVHAFCPYFHITTGTYSSFLYCSFFVMQCNGWSISVMAALYLINGRIKFTPVYLKVQVYRQPSLFRHFPFYFFDP